jgi:NOL1/NOP2/sun family putative RNA methylase
MNLPEKYTTNMRALLGDDYDDYLKSFNDTRLYGLRVNTLKISVEDFLKISPFKLTPIPWIENGFYYSEEDKPAKHPYYFAGLYYIQEPSAMTPANVLPIDEGDVVLDMCAAPGGKSTELGAKLNRTGLLVTNDISNSRAKALLKNVEVFGIPNLFLLNEDPVQIKDTFAGFFDKVLIDAPCSGEGMFRKDNKLIKAWEKNGPEFYSAIQRNIIVAGADMLKPGGKMVYSTCTFSQMEDEETIKYLLDERPDMRLLSIKPYEGFSTGICSDEDEEAYGLRKTVRIFPHKMQGEGHFVALLEKDEESAQSFRPLRKSYSGKIAPELEEFIKLIKLPIKQNDIYIRDTYVYWVSPLMLENSRLRVLRSGLLLGELKKNRFEPSQALAMALKADEYPYTVSLPADDERVVKYLKGETIDLPEFADRLPKGWVLFAVDGYPLGWGKYDSYSLKNKYLAGWRWM